MFRLRTLPAGFIPPCLPTSAPIPPSGDVWLHEIKHDGFRVIARKTGKRVKLYSRPGNDLTYRDGGNQLVAHGNDFTISFAADLLCPGAGRDRTVGVAPRSGDCHCDLHRARGDTSSVLEPAPVFCRHSRCFAASLSRRGLSASHSTNADTRIPGDGSLAMVGCRFPWRGLGGRQPPWGELAPRACAMRRRHGHACPIAV
jgi:hypothetical protein